MPVCIWFHGLGQDSSNWHELQGWPGMPEGIRWIFPQAPTSFVAAFGRQAPNWMDMPCIPLTEGAIQEKMANDQRLFQSIATAHNEIQMVLDSGVPEGEIYVGGFSQGGAIAVLAALSFPGARRLAGAINFSGWLVTNSAEGEELIVSTHEEMTATIRITHPSTPILWWHGALDKPISVELQRTGAKVLADKGCINVTCRATEDMGHEKHQEQEAGLGTWMTTARL